MPLLTLLLLAMAVHGCALTGTPEPGPGAAERLPMDPALVTGTLPNGLAYIIRRHQNPPGRLGIWLHVDSGSLNETEETRGLAHYLEHLAFNGTANFPPGSVIPFFQSLGMAFGRDQNAFTSFDRTVYTMALPHTRPETLDSAFLFLSDVAFRMSLQPKEVEDERQIILEEKRWRAGARQRVQDQVIARLAPESTLGRRLPIGVEESIRAVGPAHFREYYSRWYVASNMTVIAVGDLDPALVVDAISRHFGSAPKVARPAPRPVRLTATSGLRSIVVTDPELAQAEVSFTRVEPARPPITTTPAYRRQLVEDLGVWMLNRRMEADLAEGRASFLRGNASISRWAVAVRVVSIDATATPERWRAALGDLGVALERARQHGFTANELSEARTALIAHAEQAAQQEATRPAQAVLRQLGGAVSRREPPMSAAQRLALQTELLPGIAVDEVARAFAASFDPANTIAVLTLPASAGAPSEAELVGLARTALDVRPGPAPARERPASLLAGPPPAGKVVEESRHEVTGVWSAWLDNGIRVHHRRVDLRRNEASITITLAGGVIQERAANRGITEAAVQAWDRPATRTRSSTDIRQLMTGKKVTVRGDYTADTVSLTVSGDPVGLTPGLELAYLLLTDPLLEPASFEQWREGKLQEIAERERQPRGVLAQAEADAFYPADESRLRPVTAPQVRALTRDAAQAWLATLVARAPIEVAVVGDIDRERAADLVTRHLGGLATRVRIDDKTLRELRAVRRSVGPLRVSRTVATQTDQAQVLGGFFGADLQNVRDSRLLALASRVLSTRMSRVIREERQLVYSINAFSRPAEAYPGLGRFAAQAPTDPAKVEPLGATIDEMFTAFAESGPTAEELAVAKRQLENLLDVTLKGPDFWTDRLAVLDYRGVSLDDIARIVADYRGFTGADVREAFARYARPESQFRLVILPERAR
ncbi:MAG TPA: insulinase family protein [Candidatus Limnocylindrales bacterium]|nr:insulinase family protein [Candidatus Limnocylindrales bacterium]